jgi:uncharacterized membrane protein
VPVVGWVASIVILASEKFRYERRARFHAFQGLYLFVAWLVVQEVISPMLGQLPGPNYVGKMLTVGLLCLWFFMLVKTSQQEDYSLPILGELAEKSMSER